MKTITPIQLNEALQNASDKIQIIDVREDYERDICMLEQAMHIPLNTVPESADLINKDGKVVIHCKSGVRSANAIAFLENNFKLNNLYNLEGGILAWVDQVDTSLEKY